MSPTAAQQAAGAAATLPFSQSGDLPLAPSPHSKTLRDSRAVLELREVLDCGSPLPLSDGRPLALTLTNSRRTDFRL